MISSCLTKRIAVCVICILGMSAHVFAHLGQRIEGRTPYNAFILDPTWAENAPFLCSGNPITTKKLEDPSVLPESVRSSMKGEGWFITTFRVDGVVRGKELLPIIRIAHSWGKESRAHAIVARDSDSRRFLLTLEAVSDGLFFMPPSGGELCLAPKEAISSHMELGRGDRSTEETDVGLLDHELARAAASQSDSVVAGIILSTRYWKLDAPRLQREIARLRHSANENIGALALVWLISRGDIGALGDVSAYYNAKPDILPEVAAFVDIPASIEASIRDVKALPQLLALTQSKDTSLRSSSYYALRMIGSSKAAAVLAAGLQDADLSVRYCCIMGLAAITDRMNPDWTISKPLYDKNPDPLTLKWQAWWEEEGKAQYPSIETVLEEYKQTKEALEKKAESSSPVAPPVAASAPEVSTDPQPQPAPEPSEQVPGGSSLLLLLSGLCVVLGITLYFTLRTRKRSTD